MMRPEIRLLTEGPGQDIWRVDYLPSSQLRKLIAVLVRNVVWFRVNPMSGGLWEVRCPVWGFEVGELDRIVGR